MEDDDYATGVPCDSCGGKIDPDDPDQYSEHTGWYVCPHCGHDNTGD